MPPKAPHAPKYELSHWILQKHGETVRVHLHGFRIHRGKEQKHEVVALHEELGIFFDLIRDLISLRLMLITADVSARRGFTDTSAVSYVNRPLPYAGFLPLFLRSLPRSDLPNLRRS